MAKTKNQTNSKEENEEILFKEPSAEGVELEGFGAVIPDEVDADVVIADVFEEETIPLEEEIVSPEEDGIEEDGFDFSLESLEDYES